MSTRLTLGFSIVFLVAAISASATPVLALCTPLQLTKIIASDPAMFDKYGWSVALSGDTAIVGAYQDDDGGMDSGSAYVFINVGGTWTLQQKIHASDATTTDNFGYSVALSGDTAIVGAWQDTHTIGTFAGSAYVFTRAGGVWTQEAKLGASDAGGGDNFGNAVAVAGDTAVIGAWHDSSTGVSQFGSAYVFTRSVGVWTEQQKLTAFDGAASDQFGKSVALSGDTVLVGAFNDATSAGTGAGSAYVFVRTGAVWTLEQKLTAADAATTDQFGYSVALDGDTAVIGAYSNDVGGAMNAGSAYVFTRTAGVWSQQQQLTAATNTTSAFLGWSVAVSGNTAVVGGIGAGGGFGFAYFFTRSGGVWTRQPQLVPSDAASTDQFGSAVAVGGNLAVIGAYTDSHSSVSTTGSAYIFSLGCPVPCCAGDFDGNQIVSIADIDGFVAALLVSSACTAPPACCPGDLNADGVSDGRDVPPFVAKLLGGGSCP